MRWSASERGRGIAGVVGLANSGKRFRAIVVTSQSRAGTVAGIVFRIIAHQIATADAYKVPYYLRVETQIASSLWVWEHVKAQCSSAFSLLV